MGLPYKASLRLVGIKPSSPILKDENGNIVPLSKRDTVEDVWMWRGDGFYCKFNGLQKIYDAISMNSFIEISEDEVFDIK